MYLLKTITRNIVLPFNTLVFSSFDCTCNKYALLATCVNNNDRCLLIWSISKYICHQILGVRP